MARRSSMNGLDARKFWARYLVGAEPCHFPSFSTHTERGNAPLLLPITPSVSSELCAMTECDADSLASILRVAWALLLQSYTGMDEVCFRFFEARRKTGLESSTQDLSVARVKLSDNDALSRLLEETKKDYVASRRYQSRLIQSNHDEVLALFSKIANTEVAIRHYGPPWTTRESEKQLLSLSAVPENHVRLNVKYLSGGLSLFLEWWGFTMPMSLGRSVAATFEQILRSVIAQPKLQRSQLALISNRDLANFKSWNCASLQKSQTLIHDVFSRIAIENPEAAAIDAWDASLTYEHLNRTTSDLAAYLVEQGVRIETSVALCFNKSAYNLIAMIAVLKAGGTFVPLDSAHPPSRLSTLARRVNAELILCSSELEGTLQNVAKRIICIDASMIQALPAWNSDPAFVPSHENSAYIIYTSGSTGEPKPTVMEHGAFVASARAHGPALLLNAGSRALQFAAHTFDASLVETLTVLLMGGCVCIPTDSERLNSLPTAMTKMRVNWACLTPSFVNFLNPIDVPTLESLVLAGEAMSDSHLQIWSDLNLVNGYGPSEAAICCTANSRVLRGADPANIGRPVGVHCWIVAPDDHNRLLPAGCVGELLLEGPTLARGYMDMPDRTHAAFVLSPSWTDRQGTDRRFYKTGDLARWDTEDGSLRFCGRKDSQVKVHGQRVELAEIEHHIIQDSQVKHALVLFPKAGFCRDRLVAVLSHVSETSTEELTISNAINLLPEMQKNAADLVTTSIRETLQTQLPVYMVPALWIPVQSLPMLSSGKLDRKKVLNWIENITEDVWNKLTALVEPVNGSDRPLTDLETNIQHSWSHVLNVHADKIGLQRSFLSLGGDSITALQVVSQLKKRSLVVSVQDVLRAKSIEALATNVVFTDESSTYTEETEIEFALSPIQQMFFALPNQGRGHFNQSFFLKLDRVIQFEQLERAVHVLIKRHSMLRSRFARNDFGGGWSQRVTEDVSASVRLRHHHLESRNDLTSLIEQAQMSLDPQKGPLFAGDLFDMANSREQLLFLVGHHLVIDLVSWRIILEELEDLLEGRSHNIPPPTLPFQSWCQLQLQHCKTLSPGDVLPEVVIPEVSMAYWDMEGRPNTYGSVACEGFELDAAQTHNVTSCHATMKTDVMDILASTLIHSFRKVFTDRDTPALYVEGHGREPWDLSVDLSRTVGWFTTMYPIHLKETSTPEDAVGHLRRVKDFRRRVLDNGRPYFASRILNPKCRSAFSKHWPLELTFNYLGQYQQLEREESLLKPAAEMSGEARSAGNGADYGNETPRFGLFEISAVIVQGQLRFSFTFNRSMRHQALIRRWISTCRDTLVQLAETLSIMPAIPTLADFPGLQMTYDDVTVFVDRTLPALGIRYFDQVEEVHPCSNIQEGLLLSRSKDTSFYAVQIIHEVKTRNNRQLDTERFCEAWRLVVQRHAMLRTIFIEAVGRGPEIYDQIILRQFEPEVLRLSYQAEEDCLEGLKKRDWHPSEVQTRPPHRFTVATIPGGRLFCRLEIAHTIMDGTSMSVIMHDLAEFYEGTTLPVLPAYNDYVKLVNSEITDLGASYWQQYLHDTEPCHFPILNDGLANTKKLESLRITYEHLAQLQKVCENDGITLSNAIHVAWALTLSAYTGQSDVSFGYLISGRDVPIPHLDVAVGPFINTLICRVLLEDDHTLGQTLDKVQQDYLDAIPHRFHSLAEVQHSLELSETAPFNTALSYRRVQAISQSKQSLSFIEASPIYDPTEYHVSLNVEVYDDRALIDLDFWSHLLSHGQAEHVASLLVRCLDSIMLHKSSKLKDLDCFSPLSQASVQKWNATGWPSKNQCIHEVFATQAALRPAATAIDGWDATFTYKELDDISNNLAHHLVSLGVVPDSLIPLCSEKSAWAAVAMLAVLKAGGGFVPLDSTHPRSALQVRVQDAGARIVLASAACAEIFEDMVPQVVTITEQFVRRLSSMHSTPATQVTPNNIAVVIYTSGSTGRPKGVVLTHDGLTTSSAAHGPAMNIGPETRALQFAAYTFDNTLEEIFTTLMLGGCVCVPTDHDRLNDLAGVINKYKVNWTDLTPTVASFLKPHDVPYLKNLGLGGEAVTKGVLDLWRESEAQIHCVYGPSECSINCSWNGHVAHAGEVTNIGRAVGCVLWIVEADNHDKLCQVGCAGELLVEGPIVGRGYLNDAEKTAASFIMNPLWSRGVSQRLRRMYKTGDLCRYNSDGSITYLGRKDTQVKLNGQRLELADIEHHLQTSMVENAQAVVELVEASGRKQLAAFLCLRDHDSVPVVVDGKCVMPMTPDFKRMANGLQQHLGTLLPSYMVPTMFVPISSMPLTSSGKLNRKKLKELANAMTDEAVITYRLVDQSGRSPSTHMEMAICSLWKDILRLGTLRIGVEDNFFRLGADSIGAMKLVNAARSQKISLSIAAIFQQPRLVDMARSAEANTIDMDADVEDSRILPFALLGNDVDLDELLVEVAAESGVSTDSIEDMYPCTQLQEGLVALSTKQPGAYVAQNTYKLAAEIDLTRFKLAWEAVVEQETVLRTRVVYTKRYGFVQVVVREPVLWYSGADLEEITLEDRHLPSHNGGELSRYAIIGNGYEDTYFVWTIHHALYDGWCISTILERVEAQYKASSSSRLGSTSTFPRFIKYLQTLDAEAARTFWTNRLAKAQAPQFPAPPHPTYQPQAKSRLATTCGLKRLAGAEFTVASLIRAAWGMTVASYSASDDVIFGETLTGRDAHVAGIEDMIGSTLATIPSRICLDRDMTVTKYLRSVQQQSVEAIAYQHIGIQTLRRLNGETASACQFQNLIAINQGIDDDSDFWNQQGDGSSGTDFYTYSLMLQCNIGKEHIAIEADFDQQVISNWMVKQVLQLFTTLINCLGSASNADRKLGDLDILSTTDENTLLSWNKDWHDASSECIHEMISKRCEETLDDKVAITGWDGQITYGEMESASTCLAYHLVGCGVSHRSMVPILFDKSVWAAIAILGILKAGAAWVPLDPTHPLPRLRELVNDTAASMIVCSPRHQDLARSMIDKVLLYNSKTAATLRIDNTTLPVVSLEDPAYVIFTSGTTGKPKGTIVPHKAIATSALAQARSLNITSNTRALQFASYTFDASITEIIVTLISGGTVCVPSDGERLNNVAAFIGKTEVNWTLLTPTFIQMLQPSQVPSLETVVLGGEAVSQQNVTTWMSDVQLLNAYGPTEAAVVATVNEFSIANMQATNIGKGVVGRTWIVDAHNTHRLAPIGSTGELLLEGPALAAGYLNNITKTSEVFVEDLAWTTNQSLNSGSISKRRFYCTGDLVRYDETGSIHYIGRKDNQAKLRGQRMELGEVEHHLKTDPLIKHAHVVIPSEGPCQKKLVAVVSLQESAAVSAQDGAFEVVTREGAAFNVSAIRDRLTGRLPGYMIPSKWVVLKQLPLLSSSKLDQRSIIRWLQSMSNEVHRQITDVESTIAIKQQPSNASERSLQQIVGQVLNLLPSDVDLSQSFMHLGGDSISAMQVVARCRAENLGLNVQDIIKSKTIASLAAQITTKHTIAYSKDPINMVFPLSPMQKVYFENVGDHWQHFNQSVLLQVGRDVDERSLKLAIETVIERHDMLRARFVKDDVVGWQQLITSDTSSSFRYNEYMLRDRSDPKVVDFVGASQRSLDVQHGPLFAADVFHFENEDDLILSLLAHHLIIDVVSWRIILQDLEDILASGSARGDGSLPFQTWIRLQKEHASSETRRVLPLSDVPLSDFAYWGMADVQNLHQDVMTKAVQLNTESTLALLGRCNQTLSSEPVDIFLAALLRSFRKTFFDRETTPAIYNEGHGREPWDPSLDLSQTVGWFTTMTPVYLPASADDDTISCVSWVKDLRQRTPDKGRPYFAQRWLTEEGQRRFVGHHPMEITFNYLGQMQQLQRSDTILQPIMNASGMPETSLTDVGPLTPRFSLFEISASVSNGGLAFTFAYNKAMRRQDQINDWMALFEQTLENAAKRLIQMNSEKTLADFPLLPLVYNGIQDIKGYLPKVAAESLEEIEDIYPVSPMQHGILLSQLRNPEHYAFTCVFEAQSHDRTPVDPGRLAEAWQAVVHRHGALRTAFVDSTLKKGGVDQVVLKHSTARTAWLQCEESNALEILRRQKIMNCREVQPPHRFTLCLAPNKRVYCKLEMSHAISDGTSMPLLLRDLAHAYNGAAWSNAAPLYRDFIAYLGSGSRDADINYWKTYLAQIDPCHFPTLNDATGSSNEVQSFDGRIMHASELQAFCTKHGFTLSNLLQFAWGLVLRCYSGSKQVCFGYVASGRDVPVEGIHEAVGAFINMLVCRLDLPDDLSVEAALQNVQNDFVDSMAHQTCSLAEVQHELKLSGVSLFNTAFTYQKRSGREDVYETGLFFDVLSAEDPSEYSITLNAEAYDDQVNISLTYWLHTISNAQAERIFHTFAHLLAQITQFENQDKAIGALNFFSQHDQKRLEQWNGTLPRKVEQCVHEIISYQALQRPKSTPAICAWNARYTYMELDRLTDKLAAHLISLGVGPELFVPLCFEKSAFYVVSLLSVMKAGGAFVPLDPAHPGSRIKSLVDNVKGSLILCSPQFEEKAIQAAKQVLVIDNDFLESLPDVRPAVKATSKPTGAAYIIFTSGTTGMPKGTVIEHGAFCTGALAHSRAMNMTSASRVLQFASHTFDASIMEILSTLVIGGCVCIPSDQARMNDLPAAMEEFQVTWTLLTPSVANTVNPRDVPSLRVLVTGGEAMSSGHIEKWSESKVSLVNAYGPSETSVIATISVKVDTDGKKLNADPANIGHAVGGRCWIVDPSDHNKLMPVGCVGELVVEGRIVAREYLNNAAKTAAAFISNPTWMRELNFGDRAGQGERMYRTGDLVRYNNDGSFSFISRKDTQIKLNGQRIELGEIEYHVRMNLPDNSQAAVELVTPPGKTATKALAAFFCYQSDHSSSGGTNAKAALAAADESAVDQILLPMTLQAQSIAKTLEQALAMSVPSYMVPAMYVPLSKLPWTSAGKLDRQRLRNIVQALPKDMIAPYRLAAVSNKRTPGTQMEKRLQLLWESVLALGKDSVGVEDNFFRIGGDSLAAMRLVSAAALEKVAITVINIFRKPKLGDMAKTCTIIEDELDGELKPFILLKKEDPLNEVIAELAGHCRVSQEDIVDAYPCSSLQEGLFTLSIKQAGAYVANNVFNLPRTIDLKRFQSACEKAVQDVDILRTRLVHMRSSAFVQAVLKEDSISWNYCTSLASVSSEPPKLPAHNGGPLTKYTVVDEDSTGDYYFVWAIHHALYDGWSLPLVLKRIEQIYFEGETTLPKTAFATFVKYLAQNDVQISEDFWRTRLAGAAPLAFPPPLATVSDQGNSTQTIRYLATLSQPFAGMGVTMPTLIRAAWAIIVAAYSGSDDVIFGETMTGRDVPVQGIAEVLGPTLTTVPTRVKIDRQQPVMNFLEEVGRMNTDAIPYQHLGLQHIRRLDSDTALSCDFQNLLVIQTAQKQESKGFWDVHDSGMGGNFFTYPLVLEARAAESTVELEAHFDSRVLPEWTAQRVLCQFETVMQQLNTALRDQIGRLSDIITVSTKDLDLIRQWNGTMPEVVHECIHELIIEKAHQQPLAQAVCAWDGELSYGQLREYSSRLAYRLTKLDVGREVKVPICLDKSRWALVAIIAVLMAGGAYVPLDPRHPEARHAEISSDVHAQVILCSPQYVARCSKIVPTAVRIDEEMMESLTPVPNLLALNNRCSPDSAAYVLYTSGSTGKPKGTVIEHRAFCSSSAGFSDAHLMDSNARVFQFGSFTFDVTCVEIFSTLILGGTVCVPSEDGRLKDTGRAIDDFKATWTLLTPSVANIIEPSSVPSLKVLVCGGEAMSIENIIRWEGHVTLVNAYGPTEASVIAAVNNRISVTKDPSTIGRPTCGFAWITDPNDHDRLAPVGAVGEMLLQGPSLAREYLHNAEKTRAAFVTDPKWMNLISEERNQIVRLYKTGDLVRYNQDGTLAYIGRKDNQVKLNGQRLELGEIEHRLDTNAKIRHSLVLLPKKGPFKRRLVGVLSLTDLVAASIIADQCFLVEGQENLNVVRTQLGLIQTTLSGQLPPYMVPTSWIVVDQIPLLPSGKLDRRKVSTWVETLDDETFDKICGIDSTGSSGMPTTVIGKLLQDIIARVLNIPLERVNLNQSFLALGGDSITAMQVMARCSKEKVTLSLNDILRSKSISHMALCATTGVKIQGQEEQIDQLFELSPVQRLYMESATSTAGDARFNQSFTLRITRRVDNEALENAIETIVAQHSMLRARFVKLGTGWQQKITADAKSSYRFQSLSVQSPVDIVQTVGRSQAGLNIEDGPLFSADLFDVKDVGQVVVLVGHHLIIDMVSWRVILQDLEELLESGSLSMDKPLSFQAWSAMQAEHAAKNSATSSRKILPFKVVPADLAFWGMADTSNTYENTISEAFTVGKTVTAKALGKANDALHTEPIELFLSVLAHSFSQVFADRPTPTFWNEGHGREAWDSEIDLSRTVGWFTTIAPAHVEVTKDANDVVDTVKRLKDSRRKIPANGRPYFAHRYLTAEGRWQFGDHMPMEIVFNYLGRMQQLEADDSLLQQFQLPATEEISRLTADVGPKAKRFALFEISAVVVRDELQFSFIYNRDIGRQAEIRAWMSECKNTLEHAVNRLTSIQSEPTLSDYPILPITYDEMHQLVDEVFPELGIRNPDEVEDVYPCAPMQEGLFLSQLRDPASYLVSCTYEVEPVVAGEKIDGKKLFNVWQKVIDRHPVLRSVFVDSVCKGGGFDQVVLKKADSGVLYIECDDSEAFDKLAEIRITETAYKKKPKLPHQGTVCVTTSGKVLFQLEVNHAVIDGGSSGIIVQDFIAAYEDRLPEGEGPLYSNYIKYIRDQPPSSDVTFWTTYLENLRPCYFPTLNTTHSGAKENGAIVVKFTRYNELQDVCVRTNVTFSNIMEVAWALVLRKYTKSDDVCFGYLTAGRDAPVDQISESVGAFINMLVCRIQFTRTHTLHQIFERVQNDYLESLPYQHCSLAQVQHELGLEGKALFNTAMSIQNHSTSADIQKGGITMEAIKARDPSEYSVTVNVEAMKGEEGVVFRYWTHVVSHEQIKTICDDLTDILTSIIENSQQTLLELDGISDVPQEVSPTTTPVAPLPTSAMPITSLPGLDIEHSLRKIVTECVKDVVAQLVQSGQLQQATPREVKKIVSQKTNMMLAAPSNREMEEDDSDFSDVENKSGIDIEIQAEDAPRKSLETLRKPIRRRATTVAETPAARRATRNAVRHKMLELWGTLLDMEPADITNEDSFFGLGGDSIIAMKMVGLAREKGLAMTVADVFKNPTFGDMSQVVTMAGEKKGQRGSIAIDPEQAKREAAIQVPYHQYALLKADDVEAFLQLIICPMVKVFRGGIVDVLPVTDFQGLAITGAMLQSKWMLNYFYLDGAGPLDIVRLRSSAFRLIQIFDILRTVFVPHQDQFLQVVLRKLHPDFVVEDTDKDLDVYAREMHHRDLRDGVRLGDSYVKFVVVRQRGTERHRIFMRMSHAQYDGVCFSKILMALRAGYHGESLDESASFASYVWSSAGNVTKSHYEHWAHLLKGSRMTHIVRRDGPNYSQNDQDSRIFKEVVKVPSLASQNITTATVVKAAWALVLAKMTAQTDVVFGHVISGRNEDVDGIENIVGPCLNMVPVRIRLQPGWTAIDLLRIIQEQQVANMPYEGLGFREITKHCTDWPDWTYFSTICQHQNIDRNAKITMGGNSYDLGALSTAGDFADLSVLSTPLDGDDLELSLSISSAVTSAAPNFANNIMRLLCETVQQLAQSPHRALPDPMHYTTLVPQTIIENVDSRKSHKPSPLESGEYKSFSSDELSVLSHSLARAWREILGDSKGQSLPLTLNSSFFNLGGDIMGMAQVASLLEQDGYSLRVDDLVEYPVLSEQLALMCLSERKKKRKEEQRFKEKPTKDLKETKGDRRKSLKSSKALTMMSERSEKSASEAGSNRGSQRNSVVDLGDMRDLEVPIPPLGKKKSWFGRWIGASK